MSPQSANPPELRSLGHSITDCVASTAPSCSWQSGEWDCEQSRYCWLRAQPEGHHRINRWYRPVVPGGGGWPPALSHVAVLAPTRAELSDALRRVIPAGMPLEGASDHGVSEAIYLCDPDGNGVELSWDKPKEQWPHGADGG